MVILHYKSSTCRVVSCLNDALARWLFFAEAKLPPAKGRQATKRSGSNPASKRKTRPTAAKKDNKAGDQSDEEEAQSGYQHNILALLPLQGETKINSGRECLFVLTSATCVCACCSVLHRNKGTSKKEEDGQQG